MLDLQRAKVGDGARPAAHKRRFRPAVEPLERRDAPAALAVISPAGVYGTAKVAGGPASTRVRNLVHSNSGNIVSRSSGWTQAYTSLTNYSGASNYKTIDVATSAYARNTRLGTEATARTTQSYGAFQYVFVRVQATAGEQQGQAVRVTLTPRFVSTIGPNNRGYASNNFSFYVNGGNYLSRNDTSRGIETFRNTVTVNSSVGSTVKIAFYMKSYVGASNSVGNVANMQFSLGMSVQTTGGRGVGGGSQYGRPPAPNRPVWYSSGGRNIYLYWNDVARETRYTIQYWKSSTRQWVTLATRSAGTTWISITNGRGYYWRVGAANSYGTSYSAYVYAG